MGGSFGSARMEIETRTLLWKHSHRHGENFLMDGSTDVSST